MSVPEVDELRARSKFQLRQVGRILVPAVFYGALAVFLVLYLNEIDYDVIASIDFEWAYIGIATAIGILSRYWTVVIWLAILKGLGVRRFDNIPEMVHVYAKSWLGRYIPGAAPWILGKIYFASRQGISKSKLAVSSFMEAGLQVIVLLVLGLGMLIVDPRADLFGESTKWLMAALSLCGVAALLPPVFNRLAGATLRLAKKRELRREDRANYRSIWHGTWMYFLGALGAGTSTFFIARSVSSDLPFSEFLFVVGASCLATAVSMVAVFAPGGIGVREAILVALLGVVMPAEHALVATVVLRLWSVALDFLFFGLSWIGRPGTASAT